MRGAVTRPGGPADRGERTLNRAVEIELDPTQAARDKARRLHRFNVVTIPTARLVGNGLLVISVALHNLFLLGSFDPVGFAWLAGGLLAYSLLSWAVLYVGYERLPRLDLPTVFLTLDVVAWTFAIYASGGERSWLFTVMLVRAADQRFASFRRVLAFGHFSVACYAALVLYLVLVEGRVLSVSAEVAKLVIIYAFNLYLAASAWPAEQQRRTLVAAIRLTREAVDRREEALSTLRASEERYRTVFEAVNEPILTTALDGTITAVNRALEEAVGYTRDELLGRHYRMLTLPGVVEESEERLRRAAAGEPLAPREITGVHKDGTHIPFEVRTALIRDEAGRPRAAVGIYRDIRKSKETERTLQQAKELAEEASRAKSRFLANMSHELRTPLNSIIGFSRVLLKRLDGDLGPRQEGYVASIHSSGTHLLRLISSVLDIARIEAGKLEMTVDEIDVPGLIDECLESSRALVLGKPVALEAEVAPGLPRLYADRTKIKQVLLNLLSNAAKFTAAGRVRVSVRSVEDGVHVSVTDTGVGIPEAECARIFEPFHRLDTQLTRAVGGTGLGLALSRQFVELHGGRIWVESREKLGSTFHFVLPPVPPGAAGAP